MRGLLAFAIGAFVVVCLGILSSSFLDAQRTRQGVAREATDIAFVCGYFYGGHDLALQAYDKAPEVPSYLAASCAPYRQAALANGLAVGE